MQSKLVEPAIRAAALIPAVFLISPVASFPPSYQNIQCKTRIRRLSTSAILIPLNQAECKKKNKHNFLRDIPNLI